MRSIRVRKDLSSAVVFFILSSILCSQVSGSGNEVKPAADSWEDYCPHTICQGVDEGRFIDNPFSCASYFRCSHGRAHDGACTEGTWFNYATQRCDVPWNVPCDAGQSIVVELECVTQEEPHYVISCRGNDELHTVPHPFDCNQYYLCVSGLPIPRRCAPNLEFNAEESQCMEPKDAHCLLAECPPYNLPLTFLPSNRSCSEFSICYYGEAVPQYCADGLHWDQENEWCTHPNNTKCVIEVDGSGEEEGSGVRPTMEFECHDDSPAFNPDPSDCTMYFLCDLAGTAHPQSCDDGLYFDVVTKHCVTRDLATCYPGSY